MKSGLVNRAFGPFVEGPGAFGLLVLRVVAGAAFILHGLPKLQNPTGWMGPDAPFPGFLQFLAAFSEVGGGLAWILGLLTPLASLGLLSTMAVAATTHINRGDPFVGQGGPSYELALVYLAVSVLLLTLGPGRLSLDALLFGRRGTAAEGEFARERARA